MSNVKCATAASAHTQGPALRGARERCLWKKGRISAFDLRAAAYFVALCTPGMQSGSSHSARDKGKVPVYLAMICLMLSSKPYANSTCGRPMPIVCNQSNQ